MCCDIWELGSRLSTACLCSYVLLPIFLPVSPMYTPLQSRHGILYTTLFLDSGGMGSLSCDNFDFSEFDGLLDRIIFSRFRIRFIFSEVPLIYGAATYLIWELALLLGFWVVVEGLF